MKKAKISYGDFVDGIKKSAKDGGEEWLSYIDDNSGVFKNFYEYTSNQYKDAPSYIRDYIKPLTDFIWTILVDEGKEDDINMNDLEKLIAWYIGDFYKRGGFEYTDEEKNILTNSDAYQSINMIDPPEFISYEDFVKEIQEFALDKDSWLSYLDEDSAILREFYDRVSLGGQNYESANKFVKQFIHPVTAFIWDVLNYVDVPDNIVDLSEFEKIVEWWITDYYSRNDVTDFPDYTYDEMLKILNSDVFQKYYMELYQDGKVKELLEDEINEGKEDDGEDFQDDRDIIDTADIGDFPSFYQWLKDRTNKGYWEENEDLARQIYEAVLKVPDNPDAIDDDPFGDWYTANEDKLKRLYDGEISDDLDEYGNLNNGYVIDQSQSTSQSNKIYFDKDFYYYATPISGYWDGGKIVLDAGYIKQHFPNMYYDLIEQGATEEETMLSYVGYNSKGIPGDLYTTGLMLPENLGNSFLYIYLYTIYDNIDTSSTLGANLKAAIENGYVNNLLSNDPAYFDLINEISENDGYNELENFGNSYNELRQNGYTTAEIIDYMSNNLGDEATSKNIENYLSSKEEYDQNDTYDKDFTEIEKMDNELKEAIDKKNNVTNNAAQALVDKYQDPLYLDTDPSDPSDTAQKLVDEINNKKGDKTEIRQLQETPLPPLGGDNKDNVQVQPSLPEPEKRDMTLSEGLYAIIYEGKADTYQVMQINADKSVKLIGFMTRQQMTDKYKTEDNITILSQDEYDDAYNKMVYGTDPGEIEPDFPPYDPTLKEYITPSDVSNFEEFYAFLQQDNETYWDYKQDEVQRIYDKIVDEGGNFESWYNVNQDALDKLYNNIEDYEIDETGNFAETVKRNPATIGPQWLYFNNAKPGLDGVSDSQIYYIVVDEKTQVYVYDDINNIFKQTAIDYKGDTSNWNEINESNFKDYTFLPDELYRNFEPTPEDKAQDNIGEQYIVPQDVGSYAEFYKFLQQDNNQYWTDNPDKAKQIYDSILLSNSDNSDPDPFGNWYTSNQDELDKIYNSISDYDVDESGNFIPKTDSTTDTLPDTSFDQGDYNKFITNLNRNNTLTQLTEEYEMGGGDIDTIYRNIYDVYVANQDNYSKINFVNDYASLIGNLQDYMTIAGGTPTNSQLIQLVQQYTDNHGLVFDEANLTTQDGMVQVVLPDATTSAKPTLFDPSQGYYQPTIGTIYAIIQKDGKGYEIIQRVPDQDGDGMTDDNLLGSNLSAEDLNKQYPGSTIVTADDWNKMTSSTETQPTGDTTTGGRKLSDYTPGLYGVKNDDGTYSIVSISDDGTITQQGANIDADKYSQRVGIVDTITQDEYDELLNPSNIDSDSTAIVPIDDQALAEQNLQFSITAANAQINNDINIMQQVDNMGVVDFLYEGEDEGEDNLYRLGQSANIYTFNGKPFYRTNSEGNPITINEWSHISDSFETDRPELDYQNVETYFFEMAIKYPKDFYNWLDEKNLEETGLSFVEYVDTKNSYATTANIRDGKYKERNKGPSDFFTNSNKEGDTKQHTKEKIADTENLGIENPATYILSASTCCLFSILIMDNIKLLSNIPLISGFESEINEGNFKNLNDVLYTGMYKEGSAIRNIIESNTTIDGNLKNILRAIFSQRTYKTLSEYRTANRFAQQIIAFFGKTDERKHVLDEHDNAKILFNIGLVCLSYYAVFLGNDTSGGYDTDTKSNLLKVISTFLEVVYPAEKYDTRLITDINNIVSLFVNEVRYIPKNTQMNNGTDEMLREVIYKFLAIVVDNTETTFIVQDLFDKNTFASMISLFNLEIFRSTTTIEDLTDFLSGAVIDSNAYNLAVKKMMITVLGDKFEMDGTILHDVLFMEDMQANVFLNNPKYNLIIPIIHPEIIGAIPEMKIIVNMFGFDVPITAIALVAVEPDYYQDEVQEDIKAVYTKLEDETPLPTEEDAKDRTEFINEQVGENILTDVEQTENGYMAGTQAQREFLYDQCTPEEFKLDKIMYNSFLDAKFENGKLVVKQEPAQIVQIVEDDEDYDNVPTTAEIPSKEQNVNDWIDAEAVELANTFYDTNPDKFKQEFLDKFPNWKDDVVRVKFSGIEEAENAEIISVKNEDKNILYLLFRGSRNIRDWKNNLTPFPLKALFTLDEYRGNKYEVFGDRAKDYYELLGQIEEIEDYEKYNMFDNLHGHLGFRINNFRHIDFLTDIMRNVINEKTDIRCASHSRGHALGIYAMNIFAMNNISSSNIKYRSFGGMNSLYKEDGIKVNDRVKHYDVVNYYNQFDMIRLANEFMPYSDIGTSIMIRTGLSDPVISHYLEFYRNALFQKSKVTTPYRVKKDLLRDQPSLTKDLFENIAAIMVGGLTTLYIYNLPRIANYFPRIELGPDAAEDEYFEV